MTAARELSLPGAWLLTPARHTDPRGTFLEWFRADVVREIAGRPFVPAQGNLSVSRRGVVRGIHFADVPPGQAKYVTCVRGAVQDVVVDLRAGSPTFGRWEATVLDDRNRCAVYLAEGFGHGFCAVSDEATVMYLTSSAYDPSAEHTVHPLDPDLAVAWATGDPVLSARDRAAPSFAAVRDGGRLPSYPACRALRDD